jgi:hypothetical protein
VTRASVRPAARAPALDALLRRLPADLGVDPERMRAIVDRARRRLAGEAGAGGATKPAPANGATTGANGRPARAPRPARTARPLRLRLPDGRTLPVAFAPALATRQELDALGRASAAEHHRASRLDEQQQRSIEQLAQAHQALARRMTELEAQGDLALVGMLRGLADVRQRLSTTAVVQSQALAAQRRSVRALVTRQGQRVRGQLRAQARVAQIQKVNAAASSLQSAAYGQKGELFARNNLLLAGNQLLWGFVDPILRGLGLWSGAAPSPLAWISPLASLITGGLTLGRFQHVRFLAGVAVFDGSTDTVRVALSDRIGPADFAEFRRRTDVPVTVMPLDRKPLPVEGQVVEGTLVLRLERGSAGGGVGRVAWTVDTGVGGV